MKVSAEGQRYRVFDDVLPTGQRHDLWQSFQGLDLSAHTADNDTDLLAGPVRRGRTRFRPAHARDTDVISETIRSAGHESGHLLGQEGESWLGFTITPWSYGVGAALGWHNDGASIDSYTVGAFVWYVHPLWDASWSGDLLIIDEPGESVRERLPEAKVTQQALYAENPITVMPRPNRLALFMGDTYHCVRRVDEFAYGHERTSITGFFLNHDPRA